MYEYANACVCTICPFPAPHPQSLLEPPPLTQVPLKLYTNNDPSTGTLIDNVAFEDQVGDALAAVSVAPSAIVTTCLASLSLTLFFNPFYFVDRGGSNSQ